MRHRISASLALLAAACLAAAAGCAGAPPRKAGPAVPGVIEARGIAAVEPAADPRPFGSADTAFGLDVLRAWCAQYPRQNLVFSPSTLATALGMAYLGAGGTTAQAMARVLHLPTAGAGSLSAGLQARSAALARLAGPGVTLAASDQVWADPSLPPLRRYLNAVATGYAAGVAQAPFGTDPQRAADEINQVISAATRGQIPKLVTPDMLSDVGWVLTAALYLNAAWARPFDPAQTQPGAFTPAASRPVSVPFMNGAGFRFATVAGWSAVSLPYRGGKLTMTALLPPAGAGGCALPTPAVLGAIAGDLRGSQGSLDTALVSLPRVSLRTDGSFGDMKPVLARLGMGVAFTDQADFTSLSPKACCLAFVRQAATLRVGEKGTVAAAAAAVGVTPTAGEVAPHRIVFDRPFLMLVSATSTGEPLFLAKVADPAAG